MSSLFSKFKGGANNPATISTNNASKRDNNALQLTPLERLLIDAGPVRDDGSDKLYGMENFGSTCYYNSIIQCLYHSPPFREHVLNFPSRTPLPESLLIEPEIVDVLPIEPPPTPGLNGFFPSLSPSKIKTGNLTSPTSSIPKKPMSPVTNQSSQLGKEENKDSPEYKKKIALQNGPIVRMDQASDELYGMPESMFTSLKHMFESMIHENSRTGIISPRRGTELVRSLNAVFSVPMHQDAHECLNFVLNEIVEDLEKYAKQTSTSDEQAITQSITPNTKWVRELFEGTMTSETKCLTCQNTSAREEAYLDISVDLGLFSSVTSCLLKFSEEEMLNERNKFHCDSCHGLQEAEKRMKIKKLPKILSLHLKRFTYTEDLQRLQKLHHRVAYPYYLRLFNLTDDAEDEDQDKLYELYAVVVHIGMSPYQGHYVSIIKTSEWGWLLFDDENVEPVDKSFVRNFFGSEQGLACAYVLFYKETTFEAAEKEMDADDKASVIQPIYIGTKEHANGKMNGNAISGILAIPTVPFGEFGEFAPMDRSITAPLTPPLNSPNGGTPFTNTLEHVTSSPSLPFLGRKKSAMLGKKSAEREEKEKEKEKEREKETVKPVKEKKKDSGMLHRWQSKSNIGKEETTAPRTSLSTDSRHSQAHDDLTPTTMVRDEPRESLGDTSKESNGNGFFSHNMHRFKQSSKSLKGRPKLWPTKSKTEVSQQAPPVQSPYDHHQDDEEAYNAAPQSYAPITSIAPPQLPDFTSPNSSQYPSRPENLRPRQASESNNATPFLFHATTYPDNPHPHHEEPLDHSQTLTPQLRPEVNRTPTPTALPTLPAVIPIAEPPADTRKKSKRSFLGLGRKKSVAGI